MKVDIAIMTIREDEFTAVRRRFKTERQRIPDGRTYLIGNVKTEKQTYTIAIARCSEQGTDASQRLAHHIIHNLDPQLILVMGIAGGVPRDEFTLGDVVVSTRIVNPNVDAWHPDGTTDYMTRGGPPHPLVENIVSLLPGEPQLAGWTDTIQLERPILDPEQEDITGDDEWREKVHTSLNWHFGEEHNRGRPPTFTIGPILSSNNLMKDPARLREILKTHRSILAVEMEIAGVYEAAQGIDHQYPVMAIRGISDIVGLQRDSKWTEYACQTAAAFTYAFIMTDPLDPPLNSASFQKPFAPSEISSAQLRGSEPSLDTQHSGWHLKMITQLGMRLLLMLYEKYAKSSVREIEREDLISQMTPASWSDILRELTALKEQGYVDMKRRYLGTHILETFYITDKGVERIRQGAAKKSGLSIFFSYAHEDAKLRQELAKYLIPLRNQNYISKWYDGEISAGKEWDFETKKELEEAQIILLLISPDFLASYYILKEEMPRAIERHENGEARVVPILLELCLYKGYPFEKLQMLPTDENNNLKAINEWRTRSKAFMSIAEGISKVVKELTSGCG